MLDLRLCRKRLLIRGAPYYLLLPVTTYRSLLCALNVHAGFMRARPSRSCAKSGGDAEALDDLLRSA